MLNLSQLLSKQEHLWHKKNVVFWSIVWSTLSLVFYLFCSGSMQSERQLWYRIGTYILQDGALIVSGSLCLRNGLSKRMPSGNNVWLLVGLALFSFLIGNLFFSLWELYWHLDPVGSLGDIFFIIFYLFLSAGMLLAITSKQVRLKMSQWLIVAGVTLYAVVVAVWIVTPPAISANPNLPSDVAAAVVDGGKIIAPPEAPPIVDAPGWVMSVDAAIKPAGTTLSIFYVWCDVALFGLAAVMILAFWGGRLSNAWQVNAQAIICFYVADMWLAYATSHIKGYQSGFMLEVFWVLGTVQFGVAAALEFEHMLARQKRVPGLFDDV
jgi:hypothetical protein